MPGVPHRYTISGSPDGVIRLWASGEPFRRARAQPAASCPTASSASSEDALDGDLAPVVQGASCCLVMRACTVCSRFRQLRSGEDCSDDVP